VNDGRTVAIVTLGCARNDVDSDQLAGLLGREGLQVIDDPELADAVVVNTCTFIAPATRESIDTILAACDLKADGVRAVVVAGCLAERHGQELADSLPEADAVVGFAGYARLPAIIDDLLAGRPVPRYIGDAPAPVRRVLPVVSIGSTVAVATTPQDALDRIPPSGPDFPIRAFDGRPWAYLKIASGCDRVCTFCAIPSWRGRFRSRPLDELVTEATWLVKNGARELVLVSENTTSYGKDIGGREVMGDLISRLGRIDDLERIRLMYLQPAELQPELIEAMVAEPRVAPYFDLSLQHVSAAVLGGMARSGSPERFRSLVASIRALTPDAVFRSSFIVGFPGETDADVDALASFLEDARIDWAGFFAYSPEEGTPAARLPDQVPPDVADERLERVTDVQGAVADAAAAAFVGRRLRVTVESRGPEGTSGRSYREAPETDGEVRLVTGDRRHAADLPIGSTVDTQVVASDGVDLIAVPVGAGAPG